MDDTTYYEYVKYVFSTTVRSGSNDVFISHWTRGIPWVGRHSMSGTNPLTLRVWYSRRQRDDSTSTFYSFKARQQNGRQRFYNITLDSFGQDRVLMYKWTLNVKTGERPEECAQIAFLTHLGWRITVFVAASSIWCWALGLRVGAIFWGGERINNMEINESKQYLVSSNSISL